MKMKSCLFIAIASFGLVGCTTVENHTTNPDGSITTNFVKTIDAQRTATAIRNVVPPAVSLACLESTNARPYISDARVAICALADSGKVTPQDLKGAVDSSGVKSIQTPEIEVAITTVYGIYSAYYGDVINQQLSKNAQTAALVPVLQALCDAIGQGLNQPQEIPQAH